MQTYLIIITHLLPNNSKGFKGVSGSILLHAVVKKVKVCFYIVQYPVCNAPVQSWVQLHKITSITITITLKYRLQLQLQLHHHNVILNYNYNYTMFISITITITVPFLRKWYFFMMEYWVNRFWVVFQFWPEHCLVTLPPLSLPTLFGSIISWHLISYMCGTSELDHTK